MSLLGSRFLRIISGVLIVALIFTHLPQKAFAETPSQEPEQEMEAEFTLEEQPERTEVRVTRLGEIKAMRSRNAKYFLNSDNTITAEIHAESVHHLVGDKWEEIDNTLVEDESVPELPLRNKSNDMVIRLARDFTGANKLASVAIENYSVFFSPLDAELSAAESGRTSAGVIYKNIYPGVDFEYIAGNDHLKENIIINEYTGKNSFSFVIQAAHLTPVLQDRDLFFVNDEGEEVFVIPAPYMFDQARAESYNFTVSLTETQDSGYILTYTADEKWLTDPARQYPVIIDPMVVATHKTELIHDTFISEANPTKNYRLWSYLKTGWSKSTYKRTRTLLKFPNIPQSPVINAADEIVKAELVLYQSWDILKDGGIDQTVTVNIHKVTEPWDNSTVTWNNQPAYDPRVYDYQRCRDMQWRAFDITPIVKGWYRGEPNNGVLIKHQVETEAIFDFNSSNHSNEGSRPVLAITYRNQSGLEGYLSYTSMDLGRSGSVSVNNYNGNLVYTHTDLSLSGNRMPLFISHVYNVDSKDTDIGYGKGWRLNLSQTIRPVTIGNIAYAEYTDGDGTIHHFLQDGGNYFLQTPGIYLDLVKNADNTYTLKDSQDNEMKFNSAGNLVEIKDNQGNKITLTYSNGRISTVTDGAGRKATLTYSNNLLTKITDPAGRSITFTYSGSNLASIKYPDNAVTTFTYSANKITKVTHPSGQNLRMTYYADNDIKTLSLYGSDGVLGQRYTFEYWHGATTVTDKDNRTVTYLFNYDGNPRNIIDPLGNVAYLNIQENLLINEMPFRNTTINLLGNHNFERTSYWTLVHEGSSSATGGFVSDVSYHGSKSVQIHKTNASGASFYRQNLTLKKGETYTLSAYLKTADISRTGNGGAKLLVRYKNAAGAWVEEQSVPVTGSHDWQRLYLTFTIPADAASAEVQVGLALVGETGKVWYDNAQLEAGPAPTSYNLVENSSFELDADGNGIPDLWSATNMTSSDTLVTEEKYFDSRSFRICGEATVNKYMSQALYVSGSKGDTFVISGWAKASSVPRDEQKDDKKNRRFGLRLLFYGDEENKAVWHYFNDHYTGWQNLSGIVNAPIDYNYIRIYIAYYQNANEAYFDGIQVNKEPVSTYSYDEKGNIISANDPNNARTSFTYNSKNDLIKAVDPKGGNYKYSYDPRHNLLTAVSPEGTAYSFAHDQYGNITESSFGHLQNENLLKNGGFSGTLTHWTQSAHNNSGVITVATDSSLLLSGMPGEGDGHLSAYQEAAVKPNTTYTLSGKIKTQLLEGSRAYYVVEELNSAGQVTSTLTNEYAALNGSADWTPRAMTFKTRSDTVKIRVYLRLASGGETASAPGGSGPSPGVRYKTVTASVVRDATGVSTAASTNYGTATWLGVGKRANGATYQTALGFSLPSEVKGKKIMEAKLYLYSAPSSHASANTTPIAIHDAIVSWSETTLTWNKFPNRNEPAELTWQCPGQTGAGREETVIDITPIVQRWADQYNNAAHGIILRPASSTNGTYKHFYSRNYTDASLRPRLVIKYDTEDSYRIIANSDDARIRSAFTGSNYGSQTFMSTGYSSTLQDTECWVKFPLTSIPAKCRIDKVTLEITEYISTYASSSSSAVKVHRALGNWSESTITWANKPAFESTAAASITIGAQTNYGIRQWDVTELVRGYHSGAYPNYGIVLKSSVMKYFNTKEDAEKYRHPRLRVEFTLDNDGPVISYNPSFGTDSVSVTLGFHDEVTGYKRHRYKWTTTPDTPTSWSSWTTTASPTYTAPGSGVWYLHVQAEDKVGNVTTKCGGPFNTQLQGAEFAWFDSIQLEEGNQVSAFNLLENSDFETASAGVPIGYKKTVSSGSPVFSTETTTYQQGDKSAKIQASSSSVCYLDIDQVIPLKPNTRYTISFWVKGEGLTSNTTVAAAYSTDGAGGNSTKLFEYKAGGTFDWYNVTKTFKTPATAERLSSLRLGFISSATGSIWFDAVTLKEEGTVFTAQYTSDGNYLKSVTDATGIITATYNYTADGLKTGELASVTDAAGNTISYSYDILSRVTGVTDEASSVSVNYTYNNQDSLERISREYFDYVFIYDSLGRMSKVQTDKAGARTTLVTHAYDARGNLSSSTFGNGQVLEYVYDALDRLQGVKYQGSTRYSYEYDARGNIVKVTDNVNDVITYYTYDLADRLLSFRDSTGRYVKYEYDKNNNATSLMEVIDGVAYTTSLSYNEDNTLKSITINSGASFEYYYDEKGLPNRVITNLGSGLKLYTQYIYNQRGLLAGYQHDKETYTYEFDNNGNITRITTGSGAEASYTYDSLNQLRTETITKDGITRVIAYEYDSHGNMVKRVEGNKETVYTYDLDRLIQIEEKEDGVTTSIKTLSYDDAGNLINDGEYTYTWQMGRQLQGIQGAILTTSYQYNENGLRTQKTVNGRTHEYTLLGGNVTREIIRDSQGTILWTIHYSYAGDSTPVSMNVNGTEYYFLKNAQGDITHIVDEEGNEVASYEYDAWGNHLSITGGEIAELNPYRYRGYRYDSETGLYYLQSRYYDPEAGRFINADIVIAEAGGEYLGNNLFVYAFNNPVNMVDDGGNWPKWAKTAVAVASVVAVVAVVATVSVATVGVGTTLLAAGSGAVSGLANKYVADVTYNALSGKKGLGILKPTSSWQDYASSAIAGAVSGMASAVAPGANKLAKNAFDALLKPGVQQCLEIASPSNPRQEMDFGKLGRDALVRFGTSYLKTPCDLTPYSALNKLIGNIPCSVTRGVIKYYRELISSK